MHQSETLLSYALARQILPCVNRNTLYKRERSMSQMLTVSTSRRGSSINIQKRCVAHNIYTVHTSEPRVEEEYTTQLVSRQRFKEWEEDKLLEEEEMEEVRKKNEIFDCLPLWKRWARNAEPYDEELRRIRYVLFAKPQFIADVKPASLFATPASLLRVLKRLDMERDMKKRTELMHLQYNNDKELPRCITDKCVSENNEEKDCNNISSERCIHRIDLITTPTFVNFVRWKGSSSFIIACMKSLKNKLALTFSKRKKEAIKRAEQSGFKMINKTECTLINSCNVEEMRTVNIIEGTQKRYEEKTQECTQENSLGNDLITLTADVDYIRRMKSMHVLKYYHRLYVIPKRHIGLAIFHVFWNIVNSIRNATFALFWNVLRGVEQKGVLRGTMYGMYCGIKVAMEFCFYGLIVSPLVHIPNGLCNSIYCPLNAITGNYFFDGSSGRWMCCYAVSKREHMSKLFAPELQREKRVIRAIGRSEYNRKRARWTSQINNYLASMGFSVDNSYETCNNCRHHSSNTSTTTATTTTTTTTTSTKRRAKMLELINKIKNYTKRRSEYGNTSKHKEKKGQGSSHNGNDHKDNSGLNPYRTLNVNRHASREEIRTQFKKLAMKYHPDVVEGNHPGQQLTPEEREQAEMTFKNITASYQILSNTEKRAAYDRAGARGLEMYNSIHGNAMNMTPEQVMQAIFGGEIFRHYLLGELLRSHWELRIESRICVPLHELEELQCIRIRQLSFELARIVDVHTNNISQKRQKFLEQNIHKNTMKRTEPNWDANSTINPKLVYIAKAKEIDDYVYSLQPHTTAENDFAVDFEMRCSKFVSQLSKSSFGRELMYELGLAYVTSAQRFLELLPFYQPKLLVMRKVFGGTHRLWNEAWSNMNMSKQEMVQKVLNEFLSLEFNSIIFDLHATVRHTIQLVLQDETLDFFQRRCRCYALWRLGEEMINQGRKWDCNGEMNYAEIIACVHEATSSAASSSRQSTTSNQDNIPYF